MNELNFIFFFLNENQYMRLYFTSTTTYQNLNEKCKNKNLNMKSMIYFNVFSIFKPFMCFCFDVAKFNKQQKKVSTIISIKWIL
jgi:hypothetical protein